MASPAETNANIDMANPIVDTPKIQKDEESDLALNKTYTDMSFGDEEAGSTFHSTVPNPSDSTTANNPISGMLSNRKAMVLILPLLLVAIIGLSIGLSKNKGGDNANVANANAVPKTGGADISSERPESNLFDPVLNPDVDPGSPLLSLPSDLQENQPPTTPSPTVTSSTAPSVGPSYPPSSVPTAMPTDMPSLQPSNSTSPSASPSDAPSSPPTATPTDKPSLQPSNSPTATANPSVSPSASPTGGPTISPTRSPSGAPSKSPTTNPTNSPTTSPTGSPTTSPTNSPTDTPSRSPTSSPIITNTPTASPTSAPTKSPTRSPTRNPTASPTGNPTPHPTENPTKSPTSSPTTPPTTNPTAPPTPSPTKEPTPPPTNPPTNAPTTPFLFGDLSRDDQDLGIQISEGLTVRVLANTGKSVRYANGDESNIDYHDMMDAAGVIEFADGNYAYVSNSEMDDGKGGVYALYFDAGGNVLEFKALLKGTTDNCGGGLTPWKTWLSCEEELDANGQCWQVDPDPSSANHGKPKKTMLGNQKMGGDYESVAVDNSDPDFPVFYTTEDSSDGALRRFKANGNGWDALHSDGETTFLCLTDGDTFEWTTDEDEGRDCAADRFGNSEGIQYHQGKLYFMAKKIMVMFILDFDNMTYTSEKTGKKFYGEGSFEEQPDQNLFGQHKKYMYMTEDGGNSPGVFARHEDGTYYTVFQGIPGGDYAGDETAGIALSPDGKRFYAGFQDKGVLMEFTRDDGMAFE